MIDLSIVLLIVLGIVAVIDLLLKRVPSILLTGLIFITAVTNFVTFEAGMISLAFGTLAFIFAYMLYEANYIGGIADIKFLIIIGMMLPNLLYFFAFVLITLIFGLIYKLTFRFILNKKEKEEVPFILALYCVYVTLWLIGGVI